MNNGPAETSIRGDTRLSIIVASDVSRDGLGVECYSVDATRRVLMMEVFRHEDGRLSFTAFVPDLDAQVVEEFLRVAREELRTG